MQKINKGYFNALHKLLEPGPVVLLTTAYKGRNNIMTLTCTMMLEQNPPFRILIGAGPWDYSYTALLKTKECVLSIPASDMAKEAVKIGNCSGDDVDKFTAFSLTPLAAKNVSAPLIKESLANIECKVIDTSMLAKYGLLVLEPLAVWYDSARKNKKTFHHNGDGTFTEDGKILNLKKFMTRWTEYL